MTTVQNIETNHSRSSKQWLPRTTGNFSGKIPIMESSPVHRTSLRIDSFKNPEAAAKGNLNYTSLKSSVRPPIAEILVIGISSYRNLVPCAVTINSLFFWKTFSLWDAAKKSMWIYEKPCFQYLVLIFALRLSNVLSTFVKIAVLDNRNGSYDRIFH